VKTKRGNIQYFQHNLPRNCSTSPILRFRASHVVSPLPFVLPGMGDPASSYRLVTGIFYELVSRGGK